MCFLTIHYVTDEVEGQVQKVAHNEIVEAIQKMTSGKATEPFEVRLKMLVASDKIQVKVMMELCQYVLDGREMPDKWKTSVIVPIFKKKCLYYVIIRIIGGGVSLFKILLLINGC